MNDLRIGDVRVTRIEEMLGPAQVAREFFREYDEETFREHESWLAPRFYEPASGKLVASNHSWLIRTGRHVILVDACSGNHKPRPGMARYHMLDTPYLDRLRAAGVEPEEVDFVCCTHLHVDHVGWNTRLENGRWVPTFPNARYLMSRREHEVWSERARDPARPEGQRNVYNDSVLPVVEKNMAEMFDGTRSLDDVLTLRPAPGHTPGQIRIDLESGGERAVFCADALHNPVQVPLWQWNTVFCEDPNQAKATRHKILSHCAEHGALLLPMHFAAPHSAYIRAAGDRFALEFIDERQRR